MTLETVFILQNRGGVNASKPKKTKEAKVRFETTDLDDLEQKKSNWK